MPADCCLESANIVATMSAELARAGLPIYYLVRAHARTVGSATIIEIQKPSRVCQARFCLQRISHDAVQGGSNPEFAMLLRQIISLDL